MEVGLVPSALALEEQMLSMSWQESPGSSSVQRLVQHIQYMLGDLPQFQNILGVNLFFGPLLDEICQTLLFLISLCDAAASPTIKNVLNEFGQYC